MTTQTLFGSSPRLWLLWLLLAALMIGLSWLVRLALDALEHRWHVARAKRQAAQEVADLERQRQLELVAHLRPKIHYIGTASPRAPLTLMQTQFRANQTDPRRNGG